MAFFTGTSDYIAEGRDDSEEHYFIQKCNTAGTRQWITAYKSSAGGIARNPKSNPFIDSSGNVYATLYSLTVGTWPNRIYYGCIVKHNSSGVVQDDFEYSAGTNEDQFVSCVVDSSGNIYISARHRENDTSGQVRASIIKVNSSGTVQWQREMYHSSHGVYPLHVILDADENPIMTIEDRSTDGTHVQGLGILKWNSSGTLQWNRKITSSSHEFSASVGRAVATPNGSIL